MIRPHPGIFDVWFRYDPPVVIVALTWQETRDPFVNLLCAHLGTSYHGDMGLVRCACIWREENAELLQILRVDASIAGLEHGLQIYSGGKTTSPIGVKYIEEFLAKYETAKIVVIIDTHCENNGRFIYGTSGGPTDYQACSLEEVGRFPIQLHIHQHQCRSSQAAYLKAYTGSSRMILKHPSTNTAPLLSI
jgi:hypothetical protein